MNSNYYEDILMVKQQSLKIIALITRLNRPALRFTTWSGRHLLHNHLTEGEEGRKKGGRWLGKKEKNKCGILTIWECLHGNVVMWTVQWGKKQQVVVTTWEWIAFEGWEVAWRARETERIQKVLFQTAVLLPWFRHQNVNLFGRYSYFAAYTVQE